MSIGNRRHSSNRTLWLTALLVLAALLLYLSRARILETARFLKQADTGSSTTSKPGSRNGGTQKPSPGNGKSVPFPETGATGIPGPVSDASGSAVAIQGTVLSYADRSPIEGATVHVFAYSSPPSLTEQVTGPGGTFQVEASQAYRYEVAVEADGFRPYQDDSFVITRPRYDLEILLVPVQTVHGRVVDTRSRGIADALVTVQRERERSGPALTAATDADGSFSFSNLPSNGRYWIEACHPAFDSLGMAVVTLPAENEVILRMQPARGLGSLVGNIKDTAGRPVAKAALDLFDPSDGRHISQVRSDSQGAYRLPQVRAGNYLVRCTCDGYSQASANQAAIAISPDREARLDFSIDPGKQISGVVVNQAGEPVMRAQVMYSAVNERRTRGAAVTTTDDQGHFQISGLTGTQYQVSVSHRDYVTLVSRLSPSSEPQTLVLESGLSLSGTVSDTLGGAVQRFTLVFQSPSTRSEKSYNFTTSDGHFEVRGLDPGSYRVQLLTMSRDRYDGTLDLQEATDVFIVLDPPRRGRDSNPLNLIKTR